jgi:uncharacterized membrane protein
MTADLPTRASAPEPPASQPTRLWTRVLGALAITGWMVWAYVRLWPVRRGRLVRPTQYHAWAYRHLAYSDVVSLFFERHLSLHLLPYLQNRIEYPVVMGLVMWVASWAHGFSGYYWVTFAVLYLSALIVYALLDHVAPRHALWFALSPLLLVYGLLNWDLFGILWMVGGWSAYRRQRYGVAGALLALGVFTKLFPVFFLPFMAAELGRSRRWAELRRLLGAFVGISLLVNLPFMVGNFTNWSFFYTFNAGRGLGADIYFNPWVHGLTTSEADVFSLAVTLAAAGYWLWRMGRDASVSAALAASLTFAVFLFVNKVYSPQYMLWLLVYAIVAEWPVWTIVLVTAGGLIDYVNSFTEMYLIQAHASVLTWYTVHVFYLGILFRYAAILISGLRAARRPPKRQPTAAPLSA